MSKADSKDGDVTGAARQVRTARVPADAARGSRFFEAVFNSAADPIVVADLSGGIVEANAAARRTLGLPGSGSPGIHCNALFAHGEGSDRCFLRRVVGHGEAVGEVADHVIAADGKHSAVMVTASPLLSEDGSIAGAVLVLRDAALVEGLNQELRRQAATDELTGLSNRRELQRALQAELSRAARHAKPLAVLMIDLDGFKAYNDTNGHLAGDEVLRQVGTLLRSGSRQEDTLARYGGDEFVAILPETGPEEARASAERMRARIASLDLAGGQVTASVGVLNWGPSCARDPNEVLRLVDSALYDAKSRTGSQVVTCEMPSAEGCCGG